MTSPHAPAAPAVARPPTPFPRPCAPSQDRSLLYVMARTPTVDEATLGALLDTCKRLGHDMSKVEMGRHDGAPEVSATPVAAAIVVDDAK